MYGSGAVATAFRLIHRKVTQKFPNTKILRIKKPEHPVYSECSDVCDMPMPGIKGR